MVLVLCEADDVPARWAYSKLVERDVHVELVTSSDLAYAVWNHEVGRIGPTLEVRLPDGRAFQASEVNGTLNRLSSVPQRGLTLIQPNDRDYVLNELTAMYMSWMSCLSGPLLNAPTAQGLAGRVRHVSEWVWLAAKAGLGATRYSESSNRQSADFGIYAEALPSDVPRDPVLVVGDWVGPNVSDDVACSCAALARLAGLGVLGVDLVRADDGQPMLAGATTQPDLRLGGEKAVDALAAALKYGTGGIQ